VRKWFEFILNEKSGLKIESPNHHCPLWQIGASLTDMLSEVVGRAKRTQNCERCGKSGRERSVDHVIEGFWTVVKVRLCNVGYKSLLLADGPTWRWFREFADRRSK
jgi:hypothetical protein